MGMYIWKESFNTGVEVIDSQHRIFLDLLNECSEYTGSSVCKGVVPAFVDKLKTYADMHFSYEEELMQTFSYIGFKQHAAQHLYFKEQVSAFEDAIKNGVTEKAVHLAAFMRDWLIRHILDEDKNMTPCLSQKKNKP